jgi:signal transduction histidine kinase
VERLRQAAGEQAQQLHQAAAALPAPALNGQIASAEVISAIAQELRQPMSSISGYTDLLLAESVGIIGALQRKFLERVKASIERMGALLDDLIRVTSIDTGTLKLEPQSVETAEVIDAAIMACSAQFRDKDITLRLDIADDLSPLKADQDALHQIVSHLLTNACLASAAEGEVAVAADEKLVEGERQLLLSVRDTGGGIPPEEQGRVFNRLYRADNPLIPGLGETGVGLSIAKVLVESHGGRIWVESEAGVGSTFHVLLPVNGVRAAEV